MPNPSFIPSTLLEDSKDLMVSGIVLAGHRPNSVAEGSDVYVNHWTICLQLVQGESIRLDMLPNSVANQPATLVVSRLPYPISKYVVHQLLFPATQTLSARHIFDRISEKGYHRYRYGDKMLECRYWTNVVMKDFRDAGFVGGDGTEAYAAVTRTWGPDGVQLPSSPEWTQGTFG